MIFGFVIKIKKIFSLLYDPQKTFWILNIILDQLSYKFNALYKGISQNNQTKNNIYNFRRNIHRLEKGLLFPNRRKIFAESYIYETVEFLSEDKQYCDFDENTKKWGVSILNLYFDSCDNSDIVSKAYDLFQSLDINLIAKDWIPYSSKDRPDLSVSYCDLTQLALRRRSIRFYQDKSIDPAMLEKAMDIAKLSPSACNRQAFKFLFFNQKEIVRKITAIPGGVKGYEVPSVVAVIGSYSGYFSPRDINAPLIDASLASMSFIFALETLGLSSVCINWPNLPDKEQKIREIITLKPDEFIVMLIGLGYPDPNGKIPYSAKKNLGSLLEINQRIKGFCVTL